MAEIVASAVASEGISRISSFLSGNRDAQESAEDKAERLEMAVLKIQSVVAVCEDLRISHLPLRRWKAKLKRVAMEGDSLLHVQKKKILECNNRAAAANTGGGTLSKYLIHAAKRFVPFRGKGDEDDDELSLRDTTLRRFERLADGADSFFRLVESSGRPRRSISLPSLTQSLLSGDSVEFCIKEPGTGSSDLILLWPWMDPDEDDADDGLVACLFVLHEDEAMWQKNLKMIILFRLSEATDVLAIATSCLEHLPPQFGAAGVTIRRLLNQTVASQSRRSNNLSAKSMWIRRLMQDYLRSDCDTARRADLQCPSDDRMVLPQPVLRVTTHCYASPPPIDDSPLRNGFPLHLVCHVSPYLLPEKYSSRFLQVDDILEMLPKVAQGFYDDETQAMECERQIWCPQSAMYCSVAPEITQPLTLSKAYLMENPSTTRRRTRRRRASHTMSK